MADVRGRAADVERLTRWVRDHGPAVNGYLSSFVRDPATAEDLFQEVFCRAWEARGRYLESGKDRGYLLSIADRLCKDRGRKLKREIHLSDDAWRSVEPSDGRGDPAGHLASVESKRELQSAMNSLSEPQRRTLLLRYWGECDFAEIANIMECPLGTVLSHCRRGLLAMQRTLVGASRE